jgi:hypothetical protein
LTRLVNRSAQVVDSIIAVVLSRAWFIMLACSCRDALSGVEDDVDR